MNERPNCAARRVHKDERQSKREQNVEKGLPNSRLPNSRSCIVGRFSSEYSSTACMIARASRLCWQ